MLRLINAMLIMLTFNVNDVNMIPLYVVLLFLDQLEKFNESAN
jgi:hypothetical protein